VKDHGGHLVNQPVCHFFQSVVKQQIWRSNKHSYKKKQPNTEHGEVSLQMKEHAYANKEDQI